MAESPPHRFGQIVGEALEAAMLPVLEQFARHHQLFLDRQGHRPCRSGKKCSWIDSNGNTHDLDFVLERGGSPDKVGMPAAFIETAWRRYTKHSRNKAQEIQGAIEPLAATFQASKPFKGAVLAGAFTEGALTQLKSLGFTVLFFPYDRVVAVFRKFGIDAVSDEDTPDDDFQRKVDAYERMSASRRKKLSAELIKANSSDVEAFVNSLSVAVSRQIERIVILVLHGASQDLATISDAIRFIEGYESDGRAQPVERYEISVRYNNGDSINGTFKDKASAVSFLETYQPVPPQVV
jgi:hypothetical protein